MTAARTAKVRDPLPYLLICALIANAASFVFPISNPANLVIYGRAMPPLFAWLPQYLMPSAAAIVVTFALLLWSQRRALKDPIAPDVPIPPLPQGGRIAAIGIVATTIVLLAASSLDWPLGLPTAPEWPCVEVELGEVWSLMLYTDGLIEGRTGQGSGRLGQDGLLGLVDGGRAAELRGEKLLDAAVTGARDLNGGELTDDVAVVLLERGQP